MSKTYKEILDDLLSYVSADIQKQEGSLVYVDLSAVALEIEALYQAIDYLVASVDPETADYDALKTLCKTRGITPQEATYATVLIEADAALPVGWRGVKNAVYYTVTGTYGDYYMAVAETAGSSVNGITGELTIVTYVEGLTYARIVEVSIPGEDADDRDSLYDKFIASFNLNAFAGNVAAYKEWVATQAGIGGCKVYPVWDGPGTVKIVLIDSSYTAVSDILLEQIIEAAYSEVVPIDCDATFVSVAEKTIDVAIGIDFEDGYSFDTTKEKIESAINGYFAQVAEDWADSDYVSVYISRLEAAVLDVKGVVDITSCAINGSEQSLALEGDEIPVLGELSYV